MLAQNRVRSGQLRIAAIDRQGSLITSGKVNRKKDFDEGYDKGEDLEQKRNLE